MKIEAERKEATNHKLKSELQHLHYQLQPHFFFNSLNNTYALMDITITISMSVNKRKVFFSIENNNFPKNIADKSGSGIGLPNIKNA